MFRTNTIKISRKLPLFFAGFCAVTSFLLIAAALIAFNRFAERSVKDQMASLLADRSYSVRQIMFNIRNDLVSLAQSPATSSALISFEETWNALGSEAAESLQTAYITENSFPTGEKHKLQRAEGDAAYHETHAIYHNGLRTLIESKGYYDAFLINPEGDIIYSVFKEMDYATNLSDGAYADSGLGKAYRAASAAAEGEVVFADMEPYAPSYGAAAAFLATPVMAADGSLLGVVAVQVPVDMFGVITNNDDGLGETAQVYIVGADYKARTTSRFDDGYSVLDTLPEANHLATALKGETHFSKDETGLDGHPVMAASRPVGLDLANWALVVEQDVADVMAPLYQKAWSLALIGLAICAMMSFLGWRIAASITRPLHKIANGMAQVASGNLDTSVEEAERGDEIGDIGKALLSFQDDLKIARSADEERAEQQREQAIVVENLSTGLLRLSQGDFSTKIETPFAGEHEKLREDFNKTVTTLNETLGHVVSAVNRIRNGAAEINQSSNDLSHRTESQAATLEETAAALEEMTVSVKSAADSARSVEQITGEAKQEAEVSGGVVQNAVTAMTEIEQSSKKIEQIISVIDDIAFQTNLLALNAGVEAARAGEAGRGFAVVASEVRALAQRSSDAAMEIKSLIGESSKQVEAGVDLVGKAGDALQMIVERVNNISQLVSGIAEGASEQSNGIGEINTGVVQLDQVTQQNAAMVEEASAACQMLDNDASELGSVVAKFKLSGQMVSASPKPAVDSWDLDAETDEETPLAPTAHGTFASDGSAAFNYYEDF
ncbi:methyl-accepting chemotaxis protein [Tritonibacter mobilis]|uniref:methyl-accepting chemotaxis protein n=1 Tax=Tritonibacter mobilis TaxID=379347 RepID=UPI001C08D159|nr:methyl-accepting chemotaxis protein [Tritonibacter mobilis]MBU3032694.1 methyl-accepting chemotaxis protein [Tritonibacter mobilis]WHQ81888.1 methyl-accepting chemotaxis protein [Tritonibacter mobilis]